MLLWTATLASATPIHPDVQKLLAQPPDNPMQFAPARAGWQGPETAKASEPAPNSPLQVFGQAASARAVRAELRAAAVPEPWALAAIAAVIVLLRSLRTAHERRRRREATGDTSPEQVQLRPAA